VHHAAFVRCLQALTDLNHEAENLIERRLLCLCQPWKRLSLHILHDEEDASPFFPDIMERGDVRMAEHRLRFGLVDESLLSFRISGSIGG